MFAVVIYLSASLDVRPITLTPMNLFLALTESR